VATLFQVHLSRRRQDGLRAPESAHQQRGESPRPTEHWLSVAEGNCVVERRGGRQPEANNQSIIKKMMNSIRPDALASMRRKWRSPRRKPTREGMRQLRGLTCGETVSAGTGVHMNQGSRSGEGAAFMVCRRPEEPRPEGDRASVVALKRGNARGAKGGRKVETTNKRKKETRTANVLWTQIGEEQRKYANLQLLLGVCWPPWQQEPFIART
jgi:hypothetical protein